MADTYLRAGQLEQALSVYETLKMTTHFEDWPFKNQIEDRLKDPRSLIKQFQKTAPMTNPDVGMMFTAPYSCGVSSEASLKNRMPRSFPIQRPCCNKVQY